MLFNSWAFACFFPLVTLLYFALPHSFRWGLLLAASCWFYACFVPAYILILGVTIVVDYAAGILMEAYPRHKRSILWTSILSNVAFLFFFKYFNFVNANLSWLASSLGLQNPVGALDILLPIGLSFHTFQAMSYTIEVYRGSQRAERHFGIYALYVMFYPQLVAGPIERPQNMLHQFRERHYFDDARVTAGLRLMLWGFIKKVVIADRLAAPVDAYFGHPSAYHGMAPVIATVMFAFQIYCDFSGYCDIALGAAQVMGFRLMQNFNRPYLARSISEFWRLWHVSLSTWFRDYVYVPLGGSRVGGARWARNILAVFMLSGLWHGANWTYVVWGGLHGVYLIVGRATQSFRTQLAERTGLSRWPRIHATWQMLATFSLVCVGWIFFRASNVSDAWYICRKSVDGIWQAIRSPVLQGTLAIDTGVAALFSSSGELPRCLALIAGLVLIEGWRLNEGFLERFARWPSAFRWASYQAAIIALVMLGKTDARQFIYFQF